MMNLKKTRWLLYGAYGYTGRLIIDEAVRRGHRPVLAGRDAAKLAVLGEQYDLDWLALDLTYADRLVKTVERFNTVLHVAGPFVQTADPMVRACLAGKTNYLDITGEIPVYESVLGQNHQARTRGISLICGVGFDIVPADCLSSYVAGQLPGATHLETAMSLGSGMSAGTAKSLFGMVNHFHHGAVVRRNGRLIAQPFGRSGRLVRFSNGKERHVIPLPWADIVTSFHNFGIPNITSYFAFPKTPGLGLLADPCLRLMMSPRLSRLTSPALEQLLPGPDEATRQRRRCYLWACASKESGERAEAWLETPEAYHFTAVCAVRCVEEISARKLSGAFTPAQAFGTDFVLNVESTKRIDQLR
jgi:short subunit dehydrogenase-like uncharacterized protein